MTTAKKAAKKAAPKKSVRKAAPKKKSAAFIKLCKEHDVNPDEVPQIISFEDACKALKIDTKLPGTRGLVAKHKAAVIANYKLTVIAEALNESKQPNWNDHTEGKYEPWFKVLADEKNPSGFGLSYDDYDYWSTITSVGSRLCFRNRTLAKYAGKQFKSLYEDLFLVR